MKIVELIEYLKTLDQDKTIYIGDSQYPISVMKEENITKLSNGSYMFYWRDGVNVLLRSYTAQLTFAKRLTGLLDAKFNALETRHFDRLVSYGSVAP
jgi:endo-1,4-beta-mannosidase